MPSLFITEVAYLLGEPLGAGAQSVLAHAFADRELLPEPPLPSDWSRISELCQRDEDLPLDIIDSPVVATAERLGATAIPTLDHRHLATVRPAPTEAFTLLP